MKGFLGGVRAVASARGIGGLLAVVLALVVMEAVGYGPAAIAARLRARLA